MRKIVLLIATMLSGAVAGVFAQCIGQSTEIDFEYKDSKPWTKGYTYSFSTTPDGVLIEFEVLDDFEGMASPMLFDKSDFTKLTEHEMTLSGKKASCTLKGYSEGDVINVLMKMPVAGGQLFTSRIGYVVGSDCSEWNGACGGKSTSSDPEYSKDPATKPWTNGYDYSFVTVDDKVIVKFSTSDRFDGMAEPDIFVFDTSIPGHPLKGDPKKMKMYGVGGIYYIEGVSKDEEIEVMMKMPIAGGVLFTERHTYIAGTQCATSANGTAVEKVEVYPNPTEGIVYFNAESDIKLIEVYNSSSRLLRTSTPLATNAQIDFSLFAQDVYYVRLYTNDSVSEYTIIRK
ncbi:MAG: T9SS type A sorting domain-containing protein [Paludibacteraceae bacterium]|nr:T9SS type A sorting domain-containing protein [Paludibacteraceae bacterium]